MRTGLLRRFGSSFRRSPSWRGALRLAGSLALLVTVAAGPETVGAQEPQADILIGDPDAPPGTRARPVRPGELQPLPSCPSEPMDLRGIQDKPEIETFMAARIRESFALDGAVDWDCLVLRFDATLGERTSVVIYRDVEGRAEDDDWGDVYHFSLNRRSPFRWFWPAPGGSNGLSTAIISAQNDGQVYVITRGGDRAWVPLD